jgi:DNA gyrase subunit A
VLASFTARDSDDVMLVTDQAKLIRLRAGDIRIMGRAAQGVILFKVADYELVVSAALIPADEEAEVGDVPEVPGEEA